MFISPVEFASPEYDMTVKLRYRILREPLGLDFTVEQISMEYLDFHVVCFNEQNEIVGCLILSPIDGDTIKMRQVAVEGNYQRQGIGKSMVEYSEQFAGQKGFSTMSLSARELAVDFYLGLGYDIVGESYLEVGIKHLKMHKLLSYNK
jgi:predicted GNAT family N-acyltransferase